MRDGRPRGEEVLQRRGSMFAGVKVESSREATEAAEGKWYSSTITDDDGDHDGGGATRMYTYPP